MPREACRAMNAPAHAALMPKLEAASGSVIATEPGAHQFRLIGLEIGPRDGAFLYNQVLLGGGETTAERLPHHVIFDRCYVHGDPRKGSRRGIALNAIAHYFPESFQRAGTGGRDIGADLHALSAALQAAQGRDPERIANPGRGEGCPGKARP